MSYSQENHNLDWTMSEPINQSIGISINTINIEKPQEKIILALATGEDNKKVREWQMYFNNKINDSYWTYNIRIRLIAASLGTLGQTDIETFNKICKLHPKLVDSLINCVIKY